MKLRRHWLQLLGFATVFAVCAGTLLAAAYDRAGVPQSTMRLSERELELPAGQRSATQENTPLTLHLVWRVEPAEPSDPGATPAAATRAAWITQSKLAQLGIPISRRVGSSRSVSTLLVFFAIVAGVIKISQDRNVGEVEGYVASISVDTVQGVSIAWNPGASRLP